MDHELLKNYDSKSSIGDAESVISDSFVMKKRTDLYGPLYHSGYLYKKPDGGVWHRRYFETNGSYLTYYKTKKMKKLLAAVNLPEVGEIKYLGFVDEGDSSKGYVFKMDIRDRTYMLRGETQDEVQKWISILTSLRDNTTPEFVPSMVNDVSHGSTSVDAVPKLSNSSNPTATNSCCLIM